jgi:hypothetical protein
MKGRSLVPGPIAAMLVGALLLAVGAMEIYARQPVSAPTPALDLTPGVSTLVLVIHGSGDADSPLLAEIVAGLNARYRDVPDAVVRFVRWSPASDQRLRAAATAQAIGSRLGAMLAGVSTLRELHLIAHSSGTFMPDAICTAWRAARVQPARITMVLLDPFQIRGFVDWTWGARQHGRCADFTLAVINTDDPAPSTNRPLAQAFNLDVTADPERAKFTRNGHYWPVQFYRDHLVVQEPGIGLRTHAAEPRGAVRPVPAEPAR